MSGIAMIIKILADGGAMAPGPALSQKLGPAGIPMPQVIQKINEATKNFKGMKVPVEVNINPTTKNFDVKVFSPPASELLKKELGIEKGSGLHEKIKVANASIEQIINVAKTKLPNMLSHNLKSAVKNIIGTCASLGILIENKNPSEIQTEIDQGVYDKEINEEITETADEKKKQLDSYFADIKAKQDILIKQEEAAKEAEKAKEAETAVPAPSK
jgi:large subunit ribosomal protein L11